MRAITVTSTGGPDVLTPAAVADPQPGPGQLLVRVRAAGVNFIDTYFRGGLYPISVPYIPGSEGAGEVIAVGPDVPADRIGQRVAWCDAPGSYAELVVVGADRAVRVPDDVSDEVAGSSLLRGLTAHYLLDPSTGPRADGSYADGPQSDGVQSGGCQSDGTRSARRSPVPVAELNGLRAGDAILLHAGAGGVGLILTQLAAAQGLRVITTVSTDDKEALSRQAGADQVLRYDEDVPGRVRELTDGIGVPIVYDGVGRSTFEQSLMSTAVRGRVVLYGAASGPVPPFDLQRLNPLGSLSVTRPTLADFIADPAEFAWRAGDYLGAVAAGRVQVRVGQRYRLAEAVQAHRDLEGRRTSGTTVLIP
ncbi:NADPH--quinone reductase [Gordonia hirsuta DSM 44140 = NBRC 16056]|uniref:NADPH--quinone reductase n=1 Tax=Gordonia hirsuta DSM 44140 = NBRC 16056 TaxID=1121927 RepID=L7L8M9_9ACTN|nr:quinone oxidoreductase [Gordonia hirsuta]GAC57289.1 NADPH--quinone reductase [Gordonia hirsuta DSM 44140 = NBRC 16056]